MRKLLVLGEAIAVSDRGGAASLLEAAGRRKGASRGFIAALLARKPARLVAVARANKLARIVFATMRTGEGFRGETFAKA